MIEYNGRIAELTRSGATAALLLDAQKHFSGLCVEEVLCKIDMEVLKSTMHAERALALVHEIAAFRRIVYRQQQAIDAGESAARHQERV